MGRKKKFVDLQEKFEKALIELEREKASTNPNKQNLYKTEDLISMIEPHRLKYEISEEELNDLKANSANYIYRAKENQIITSFGTKQGYKINPESQSDNSSTDTNNSANSTQEYEYWESFLHFVGSIMLSKEFDSKIISLPHKTSNLKWGNPDMIMIRDNWTYNSSESNFKLDLISKVDSSPKYILSSIELKYGLDGNRANVLNALSETAINGSWANENWLVYMNSSEDCQDFDADSFDFAKRNGIGLIEILVSDSSSNPNIKLKRVLNAEKRNYLQLNMEFTKKNNKTNLLNYINQIISEFEEFGSYREQDGNYFKLSELLYQAFNNLTTQKGFAPQKNKDNGELVLLEQFCENHDEAKKIKTTLFKYLPETIDFSETTNLAENVIKEIENSFFQSNKVNTVKNILHFLSK